MNEILDKKFKQKEMIYVLLNKPLEDLKPYFIQSEKTNNEIYSDLQFNINHAFIVATSSGKIHLVKYLLTSPELEMHADIHFDDDYAICAACRLGCQSLVEYLLDSSDLKVHAKIPNNPDEIEDIFNSVCDYIIEVNNKINNYEYDRGSISGSSCFAELDEYYDFLHYLIYKCEIQPTKDIIEVLKKNTDKEFYEPAIKKLKLNEVELLDRELKNNTENIKRMKI
jgi:hypothetical protein